MRRHRRQDRLAHRSQHLVAVACVTDAVLVVWLERFIVVFVLVVKDLSLVVTILDGVIDRRLILAFVQPNDVVHLLEPLRNAHQRVLVAPTLPCLAVALQVLHDLRELALERRGVDALDANRPRQPLVAAKPAAVDGAVAVVVRGPSAVGEHAQLLQVRRQRLRRLVGAVVAELVEFVDGIARALRQGRHGHVLDARDVLVRRAAGEVHDCAAHQVDLVQPIVQVVRDAPVGRRLTHQVLMAVHAIVLGHSAVGGDGADEAIVAQHAEAVLDGSVGERECACRHGFV